MKGKIIAHERIVDHLLERFRHFDHLKAVAKCETWIMEAFKNLGKNSKVVNDEELMRAFKGDNNRVDIND